MTQSRAAFGGAARAGWQFFIYPLKGSALLRLVVYKHFRFLVGLLLAWLAWVLPAELQADAVSLPPAHLVSPDGFVEYRPGTMPLLLTVPHGGRLRPATLPDRTCPASLLQADAQTQELALAIDSACQRLYGQRPYLIFCHLARRKLDVNRPLAEASCGNAQAAAAWRSYHAWVDSAAAAITRLPGQRGLLLDVHGHAHALPQIELGYLLRAAALRQADASLAALADSTGIWGLVARQPAGRASLPALLRGPTALGTRLTQQGLRVVPSQQEPAPQAGEAYFDGGYTCWRHGSRGTAGLLDAVQAETPYPGVRAPGAQHRAGFALARGLGIYLTQYYSWPHPEPFAK